MGVIFKYYLNPHFSYPLPAGNAGRGLSDHINYHRAGYPVPEHQTLLYSHQAKSLDSFKISSLYLAVVYLAVFLDIMLG